MIIYIDENLPHQLAEALNILQVLLNKKNRTSIEVRHITQDFPQGTPDETWIPQIGLMDACVITKDVTIHRDRSQKSLYQTNNLGIIFLSTANADIWSIIQLIIKQWLDIIKAITQTKKPFAFRVTQRSKLEKI